MADPADPADPFTEFESVVTSEAELAEVIGTPPPAVVNKVIDCLDELCCAFIARAPFCLIATSGADGHIDVSPKGDPAGFVQVLDPGRLAIPDRPGNRRIDTFHNLLRNPQIGILFLIPGKNETLRIRGEARIVRDAALLQGMAVNGRVPALALVVHVREAFFHCPKCMIRGHLWDPAAWPDSSDLVDIGRAMIRHARLDTTPEAQFAEAERQGLTRLY
ncbi:MAG: pyridoxamine 5'-phosphate oxidase family protein [Rhodobacteraceae bacterium]|nr:pyridoxamine 5'-phosphate oxidase family protein [Paracoccaceae bacterium]